MVPVVDAGERESRGGGHAIICLIGVLPRTEGYFTYTTVATIVEGGNTARRPKGKASISST